MISWFPISQSLCHQTRGFYFSWSESPLGDFWQTPSQLSCAFKWRMFSVWPLNHISLIGGVIQWWLSFCKLLWSSQGISFITTFKFLFTYLTKTLQPWLLSLAGQPDLLVVPNLFHLRIMKSTILLQYLLSMIQKVSCILPQICVLLQSC